MSIPLVLGLQTCTTMVIFVSMAVGNVNTDSYLAGTLMTEPSSQSNLCSDYQGKEKIGVPDEWGGLISYVLGFLLLFYPSRLLLDSADPYWLKADIPSLDHWFKYPSLHGS